MGKVVTADLCKFCGQLVYEDEWNIHEDDIVHNSCLQQRIYAIRKVRMLEMDFQRSDKQLKLF